MIKRSLARLGCLGLILLVVAGVWWLRDDIGGVWNRLQITSSRPSEALAERAVDKLDEFAAADEGSSLELSQAEIQSLLTYRAAELFPPGVSDPLVEVGDSTLLFSARVDPRELEGVASPELLERFLSDSTRLIAELDPDLVQPGIAGVEVVTLQAGSLVVPSLMVPWILEGLRLDGFEARGRMLLIPVSARVERFEVTGGALVLEKR